ncbi:type II secretion system minor pseudopilin GspK [Burkholderia sp. 22PA0106]|uniref:type II secretion system minor pseudopilin GspK n=1 Tax=Burkholderia sp. 22PA0106 TaxID=3237371 RepID=UPI0039C02245
MRTFRPLPPSSLALPARPGAHRQRGVAIISALLVVALTAILVSGMLWRQQVQIRRIENQRLLMQAQWVARGALDWTRMILRSEGDTSPGVTYLGGIWAVPIAKTRLSDFLGKIGVTDVSGDDDTYLSGDIEDAQARFNLRNLVITPAPGVLQLNASAIGTLKRLLTSLSIDSQLALRIAQQMRAALRNSATRFQMANAPGTAGVPVPTGGNTNSGQPDPGFEDDDGGTDASHGASPIVPISVASLLDVNGVTPEVVERLRPFVTVLPTVTPVNLNTARAEVIAALLPGLSVSSAQTLVARRENVFFRNVGDAQLALQATGVPNTLLDPTQIDVTSSYFIVHGHIEHGRAEIDRNSLVYRDSMTHTTRVVRISDQL